MFKNFLFIFSFVHDNNLVSFVCFCNGNSFILLYIFNSFFICSTEIVTFLGTVQRSSNSLSKNRFFLFVHIFDIFDGRLYLGYELNCINILLLSSKVETFWENLHFIFTKGPGRKVHYCVRINIIWCWI